jgi:abortive infection bacteriophage resistance protein
MKFGKPPKTFSEQVQLLQSRGLTVDDVDAAERFLSHTNYYRFAGYLLPFEVDHATHTLQQNTAFEDVANLYAFDRRLRLLVLDAIERIEVSVRTQWAYHLAHEAGAHAYLHDSLVGSAKQHVRQLATLERELDRSSETFIKHFRDTYSNPDLPPVWVVCEIMSLGQLSQWYTLMRPIALRKRIAKAYGLDQQVLQSVLQHLTYIRNICAHHGRLWNREMVVTCVDPKKPIQLSDALGEPESRKLYKTLCIIAHLLDGIGLRNEWRDRLKSLIGTRPPAARSMGFPEHWMALDLWGERV